MLLWVALVCRAVATQDFASLRLRLYGDHRLHPAERPETAIDGDDNAGDEACARPTQPDRR